MFFTQARWSVIGTYFADLFSSLLIPRLQYVQYNVALRHLPPAKYELMKETDNLYATTISVLVSAVQKIARAIKLPDGLRLYRGMGGRTELPKGFFTADQQGRKGFVDWGFISTIANEQVGRFEYEVKGLMCEQ